MVALVAVGLVVVALVAAMAWQASRKSGHPGDWSSDPRSAPTRGEDRSGSTGGG